MNEEEFFNKYVMGNPFDLKKSIIAHCRTLDKYDVYQWVADDEVKIKNLLEENQQLKEQLEQKENEIKELCKKLKVKEKSRRKMQKSLMEKIQEIEKARKEAIDYIEKFVPIDVDTILMREKQRDYLIEILDIEKSDK